MLTLLLAYFATICETELDPNSVVVLDVCWTLVWLDISGVRSFFSDRVSNGERVTIVCGGRYCG
jgi:hypothetical protein